MKHKHLFEISARDLIHLLVWNNYNLNLLKYCLSEIPLKFFKIDNIESNILITNVETYINHNYRMSNCSYSIDGVPPMKLPLCGNYH
jgi:hypothetical protein